MLIEHNQEQYKRIMSDDQDELENELKGRFNKIAHLPSAGPREVQFEEPLPEGKLRVVVTYLDMTKVPTRVQRKSRLEQLSLIRSRQPTLSFYRYLYNTVGTRWLWYERRQLNDEQLLQIIHHEQVRIYVLYVSGTPAGFAELDLRQEDEVELAYFGLIPEFIGRGLGQYFLEWTVEKAWSFEPKQVIVNTCNLDHPKAIAVYQQAGFSPYRQEVRLIDDPRATGLI